MVLSENSADGRSTALIVMCACHRNNHSTANRTEGVVFRDPTNILVQTLRLYCGELARPTACGAPPQLLERKSKDA